MASKDSLNKKSFSLVRLNTFLMMHTSLRTIEGSKDLNKIMDELVEEVILGEDVNGYMLAKMRDSSINEIWLHYEKIYMAIRNAKYELYGDFIDLHELKLARDDAKFQSFFKGLGNNKLFKGLKND